jgi:phage shock protein C
MFTGVCGGIADYLNVNSTLIRLIFVTVSLTILSFETAVAIYIILWIVMPAQPKEKRKRKPGVRRIKSSDPVTDSLSALIQEAPVSESAKSG